MLLAATLWLAPAGLARGLSPQQVAIVVNGNNPGSLRVARYYARARHIPPTNLLVLNLPFNADTITAGFYNVRVARAIRQILQMRHLKRKIRCLATTYGVPLKVGPATPTAQDEAELVRLHRQLARCAGDLRRGIGRLERFGRKNDQPSAVPASAAAAGSQKAPAASRPAGISSTSARALLGDFQTALRATIEKIHSAPPWKQAELNRRLVRLLPRYIGPAGLLAMIHVNPLSPLAGPARAARARGEQILRRQKRLYVKLRIRRNRRRDRGEMRRLQRREFGIVGLTRQILADEVFLASRRPTTALDSDLMMLWYGRLAGPQWFINPMCIDVWSHLKYKREYPRVMMVSRLDGLSPRMVIGMIRRSIRVQNKGLSGVAYFDARGLHGRDPYSDFDRNIRAAARYIRTHTTMKVALNDTPALLAAKNCPDEAIYCGWYSVHHYVDSCQWLPGSVAYHVASFELDSLHNPSDTAWCINLLKNGVCGTLGAVTEPYLFSFPLPSQFFPLLLSGRFTQAEVYYLTTPVMGWRIAYVGDPLYNPFQKDPMISLKQLRANPVLRNALLELPGEKTPVPHR